MGFSEFQQVGLTREISGCLVESESDSSDEDWLDESFSDDEDEKESLTKLAPHEKWVRGTKKILMAKRFGKLASCFRLHYG